MNDLQQIWKRLAEHEALHKEHVRKVTMLQGIVRCLLRTRGPGERQQVIVALRRWHAAFNDASLNSTISDSDLAANDEAFVSLLPEEWRDEVRKP